MLLEDFNGHTGYLREQRLDSNGKFILDLMTDHTMTLLNDDSRCAGTYTWRRDQQKIVIDYIPVNQEMYKLYNSTYIDENQEIIDICDHNVITLKFTIANLTHNYMKYGQWESKGYHRTDKESLRQYIDALEDKIKDRELNIIELNTDIGAEADERLKQTYRRKLIKQQSDIQEPP